MSLGLLLRTAAFLTVQLLVIQSTGPSLALSLNKALAAGSQFVPDSSKRRELLFLRPLDGGGIFNAPMDAQGLGWEVGPNFRKPRPKQSIRWTKLHPPLLLPAQNIQLVAQSKIFQPQG